MALRNVFAGVGFLAAGAGVACAAAPCRGVDESLTDARRQAYAPIVAGATQANLKPSDVTVLHFLAEGDWIVVGASVPAADGEGYFFFERIGDKLRFHDVWGGVAERSEAGEVAAWARRPGAPAGLSRCFAEGYAAVID